MFRNNPHGAGFMVARNGKVEISKGYMNIENFVSAIRLQHFTAKDSVVYHFRISTQADVTPEMTHPFPLTNQLEYMKALDVSCDCGVAHNGIIYLTTDRQQELNQVYIIFSPNKFYPENVTAPQEDNALERYRTEEYNNVSRLPYVPLKKFQKWLSRLRDKDPEVQVVTKYIKITGLE